MTTPPLLAALAKDLQLTEKVSFARSLLKGTEYEVVSKLWAAKAEQALLGSPTPEALKQQEEVSVQLLKEAGYKETKADYVHSSQLGVAGVFEAAKLLEEDIAEAAELYGKDGFFSTDGQQTDAHKQWAAEKALAQTKEWMQGHAILPPDDSEHDYTVPCNHDCEHDDEFYCSFKCTKSLHEAKKMVGKWEPDPYASPAEAQAYWKKMHFEEEPALTKEQLSSLPYYNSDTSPMASCTHSCSHYQEHQCTAECLTPQQKDRHEWANQLCEFLNYNHAPHTYEFNDKSKKYARVVRDGVTAYCFVDNDGSIYKPAGFSIPAKGVRGKVQAVIWGLTKTDWHGGWLYLKS